VKDSTQMEGVSTMVFVVRVRGLSKTISESCLDLGKNQDFPR
jgi:hypothetical protein